MNIIKLAEQQWGESEATGLESDFAVIKPGVWENEYKDYDIRETIYKHIPSGRYLACNERRAGSYYSDYHYEEAEFCEVWPVEVTKTEYHYKPPGESMT